ncbi:HypC/HybG/HupF family hydrogenase formation chaperone [Thermoanaerobacterium sp. RBIITD]|uniref:HypC/HybG/HupF family hydrogenase formation chaperone n=1 Tax=Thermoanaerobacterium sp. RBIITD TaxID=1550240 RepID=UPI000BB755BB|nr:HypC/HybG/HupF family hydrogenase formation chaperone [Thermoanaerobacterium sp. RBIITD]SNX53899.1 hydrogenase expression/formation protein HypC [Thermoanaerobacterium sp. RBIITD]
MCIAVSQKVVKIDGKVAETDLNGLKRRVSIEMVPGVKIGDYVMVHAGVAISIVDEKEAEEERKLMQELEEALNESQFKKS